MSVVVQVETFEQSKGKVLITKGAPEVVFNLLKEKDQRILHKYNELAKEGYRVLALAIKSIEGSYEKEREEIEKDLTFVGFLVLVNQLKGDTKEYIKILKESNKGIMMLTGDHMLTSIATYKELGISQKQFLTIETKDDQLIGRDESEKIIPKENWTEYDLAINGQSLQTVIKSDLCLLKSLSVISRVSPKQKEQVVQLLKKEQRVLMCGDGTNDVGALKMADVGIALVGKKDEPSSELKK